MIGIPENSCTGINCRRCELQQSKAKQSKANHYACDQVEIICVALV